MIIYEAFYMFIKVGIFKTYIFFFTMSFNKKTGISYFIKMFITSFDLFKIVVSFIKNKSIYIISISS